MATMEKSKLPDELVTPEIVNAFVMAMKKWVDSEGQVSWGRLAQEAEPVVQAVLRTPKLMKAIDATGVHAMVMGIEHNDMAAVTRSLIIMGMVLGWRMAEFVINGAEGYEGSDDGPFRCPVCGGGQDCRDGCVG